MANDMNIYREFMGERSYQSAGATVLTTATNLKTAASVSTGANPVVSWSIGDLTTAGAARPALWWGGSSTTMTNKVASSTAVTRVECPVRNPGNVWIYMAGSTQTGVAVNYFCRVETVR